MGDIVKNKCFADSCGPLSSDDQVELRVMFDRICREVDLLAEMANGVDGALGVSGAHFLSVDQSVMQDVDLLRQSLSGLSAFLRELQTTFDTNNKCAPATAAKVLRLRAQVSRLGLGEDAPDPGKCSADIW